MTLNIDCILKLIEILEQDIFDEKAFNRFLKTKGTKGLLEHENYIGRKADKDEIREELKKIIKYGKYEDRYQFYRLKKNLNQLRLDIYYIKENDELIIRKALKRVYKIIPDTMEIKANICLYAGGTDGGFTINRNNVFINYGKYIGQREEFINILSHELYHSRNISIQSRIKFMWRLIFRKNRIIYGLLGKSIEEGIACLIQHGATLKVDDLTGNLTRRNLVLSNRQFDLLNKILLDIKSDKPYKKKIKNLNIYVIGYLITTVIYTEEGTSTLDEWTIDLEFKNIIKKYIKLCNMNGISSGFKDELIGWIID